MFAWRAKSCAAQKQPAMGSTGRAILTSMHCRTPSRPSIQLARSMPTTMEQAFFAQMASGAHMCPCTAAQETAKLLETSSATKRKTRQIVCLNEGRERSARPPRSSADLSLFAPGVSSPSTRCSEEDTGRQSQGAVASRTRPRPSSKRETSRQTDDYSLCSIVYTIVYMMLN